MPPLIYRQHETSFCADVSKWSDKIFETHPDLPFGSSEIERFGRGSLKRQDFRVYERKEGGRGKLALCGEVKLPGAAQGSSPFGMALMEDAFLKVGARMPTDRLALCVTTPFSSCRRHCLPMKTKDELATFRALDIVAQSRMAARCCNLSLTNWSSVNYIYLTS